MADAVKLFRRGDIVSAAGITRGDLLVEGEKIQAVAGPRRTVVPGSVEAVGSDDAGIAPEGSSYRIGLSKRIELAPGKATRLIGKPGVGKRGFQRLSL
jgi:hypothetical protein